MPYDVEAIRKKIKQSMSGRQQDPDEFKPEKCQNSNDVLKYRFYILAPFNAGDMLKSGPSKHSMENKFFIMHGMHWFNNKPTPCPRVWDGSDCQICQYGFDLLKDELISKDEAKRAAVLKQWMANTQYLTNIYFPDDKINPEELRNRVMVYNANKTIIDMFTACLMRDDPGDPENPEAFGVFYDENNAAMFEMRATKQGNYNNYKQSRFLPSMKPMIRNADGTPNNKALEMLLRNRHDLFAKIEVPDHEKIKRLADLMINGDDSSGDKKGSFDHDESAASTSSPAGKVDPGANTTVSSQAKTTTKAGAAAKAVTESDDDDAVNALNRANNVKSAKATAAKSASDDLAAEAPLPESKLVGAGVSDSGVHSPEIENLLGQLDED